MGKKNKYLYRDKPGLPYNNSKGKATVGNPADHVKVSSPIKLPYSSGCDLGVEHSPIVRIPMENFPKPDKGVIVSGDYPTPFPFGKAFESLEYIAVYDETKEGAKLTKVVKSIIVRRDNGDEIYRVGEEITVDVADTPTQAKITHIDSMTRIDNNGVAHVYYDVYARIDDGENYVFHVATIYDMPVEVKFGYRPF